jgi:hypothetical protein
VESLAEANVSERRAVTIFRAEVISWDSEGPCKDGRRGSLKEQVNRDE